eukprot:TRINITY_DN124439_c0_g1_i1.p2 TRINITY_DN124439_c0_g1~~TRINITY_DN124439_c0_g1_i1.p2  ORF type:complete len:352 (+),score=90.53 TRINITY_DN124439_c0_g1_i1:102-1157(+)
MSAAFCSELPMATVGGQESLEARKMKMMQQRRMHLDKQRGAASRVMLGMAQANTHAPVIQRTKAFDCNVVVRAAPAAARDAEGVAERSKDDLQDTQNLSAAGLDLNISPEPGIPDNISEATCNLALGEQGHKSHTPTSVMEPKSFVAGEDPRAASKEQVEPMSPCGEAENEKPKEKNGKSWWKPSFGRMARSSSRTMVQAVQDPTAAVRAVEADDTVQAFDGERPASSSSTGRVVRRSTGSGSAAPPGLPQASERLEGMAQELRQMASGAMTQLQAPAARQEESNVIEVDALSDSGSASPADSAAFQGSGYPISAAAGRQQESPSLDGARGHGVGSLSAVDSLESLPGCPA